MGSFNMGCGISNLTIGYGDKTGFVILDEDRLKQEVYARHGSHTGGYAYQIYATDYSSPILPPVYGRYDDYGRLRDIEPSTTSRLLESMFRRPAEVVIDCVARQHEIYDSNEPIAEAYLKPGHLLGSYSHSMQEVLESLGFERFEDQVISDEITWEVYDFQGAKLKRLPDDNWQIETPKGKVLQSDIRGDLKSELVNIFASYTGLYPGFEQEDWEIIKRLHGLHGMFFLKDVFHGVNKAIAKDFLVKRQRDSFKQEWDDFIKEFSVTEGFRSPEHPFASSWWTRMNDRIRNNLQVKPQDYDLLIAYAGGYEFREAFDLIEVMTAVNRMLVPSYCGEQHGNDEASLALNKIERKILKDRLSERED